MKVEEWLTDLARRSGLLKQVEKYLDEVVRQRREQSEAAERAAKREKIVSALDATGLTSKDAERLLRWAEPGLLTADEALRLFDLLHNAVDNVRSGPGVLVEQRQSKRVDFSEKIKHWRDLYDTTASRLDRLQAVKAMRWWPELVDALYRGELEVAKQAKRTRGPGSERPSETAEKAVARALNMGSASVHAICQGVRDENRGQQDAALNSMRVDDFLRWLESGGRLFTATS